MKGKVPILERPSAVTDFSGGQQSGSKKSKGNQRETSGL